jgi:hypothetical protein
MWAEFFYARDLKIIGRSKSHRELLMEDDKTKILLEQAFRAAE